MRMMRDHDFNTLEKKKLLDFHRKTHMLYEAHIRKKPVNKAFVNSIVVLHDQIVKSMLKRGIQHNSPLKKI